MASELVNRKCISGWLGFPTDIAWNCDPSHMVSFYVVHYHCHLPFFSTNLANSFSSCCFTRGCISLIFVIDFTWRCSSSRSFLATWSMVNWSYRHLDTAIHHSGYIDKPSTQVGLAWVEPRLLFNNIFDWDVRRSVKVNLWHFLQPVCLPGIMPVACHGTCFPQSVTKEVSIDIVFQTNEKLIEHLWAPNLHFLTTERFSSSLWHILIAPIIRLERISTLKNAGTVTIFRNGSVHYDSHIRLTVGQLMICRRHCLKKMSRK